LSLGQIHRWVNLQQFFSLYPNFYWNYNNRYWYAFACLVAIL